MKILYVTDLHGHHSKYKRIVSLAKEHNVEIVINGGDMLPNDEGLFDQDKFITGSLGNHFSAFEKLGIHYLCYLGNDDLRIFDELFENTCNQFAHVHSIAQRKITIANHEFVGMKLILKKCIMNDFWSIHRQTQ